MTVDLGEVVTLAAGDAVARIYPARGGRLGQITVRGQDLLRGPDAGAEAGWAQWGSYPLLPWSNRIPDGRFRFEGDDFEVPVNWPDGTAIHGLTADIAWTVVERDDAVVLEQIEVREGRYHVRGTQRFTMSEERLELDLAVENLADHRVPVGLGIHPWFNAGPISVPVSRRWVGEPMPSDDTPVPVERSADLRPLRLPEPMDRCYTGVEGDEAVVPGLRLGWTGPISQVVVFTEMPPWLCVEPVTMASDGFALADRGVDGTGVHALDPGDALSVRYLFTWD